MYTEQNELISAWYIQHTKNNQQV